MPDPLSIQELRDRVVPANPAKIVAALDALTPAGIAPEDERQFLLMARDLLAAVRDDPPAEDRLLLARIHARLNDVPAAQRAYEAVVAHKPWSGPLRLEFSEFLHRVGHDAEARQELQVLLAQEPSNHAARELHNEVLRKMRE